MCLLFYVAGLFSGYLAWRFASAPQLWDAENEADYWRDQWLKLKSENDASVDD